MGKSGWESGPNNFALVTKNWLIKIGDNVHYCKKHEISEIHIFLQFTNQNFYLGFSR